MLKNISLFKQKPKPRKFIPSPVTRLVGNIDLDRKGELEKFKKWLVFVSKEKSNLPSKKEFKKLNKDIKSASASSLSTGGILGMLPAAIGALSTGLGVVGTGLAIGVGAVKLFLAGLVLAPLKFAKNLFKLNKAKPIPKGSGRPKNYRGYGNTGSNFRRSGGTGRPPITQSGGGNLNRGGFRNPLRQRPRPTVSGGGQVGRPNIRNPFRARPTITQGTGGLGKYSLKRLLRTLPKKALIQLGGSIMKKFFLGAGKLFAKVPIIGGLIDFAIRYWLFKEPLQKAAIASVAAAVGGVLLGTVGAVVGPLGAAAGALLGNYLGDQVGEWIYTAFFAPKGSTPPSGDDFSQLSGDAANYSQAQAGLAERRMRPRVIGHNADGSPIYESYGRSVDVGDQSEHLNDREGIDPKGRKIRLSNIEGTQIRLTPPAAAAFKAMMTHAAGQGIALETGVSSSYRSEADHIRVYKNQYGANWKNKYVKNSTHRYGEAIDIHWNSTAGQWIREHAHKYGFKFNNYSGSSTHFDWTGKTSAPLDDGSDRQQSQPLPFGGLNPGGINFQGLDALNFFDAITPKSESLPKPEPKVEPKEQPPVSEQVSAVPQDTEIAMFTPEAEASQGGVVIINRPIISQAGGGETNTEILPAGTPGDGRSHPTATISGETVNSILDNLMLTKLGSIG